MKNSALTVQDISLCRFCQKRLGLRLKENSKDPNVACYICNGLMSSIKSLADEIISELGKYDFDTFLIGASVPHTVLDNEDELRSRFKIKGKDSIKSQITKMLSQEVKLSTGKGINYAKPDLTVLAAIGNHSVSVNLRSVWLSGKYLKLVRGLSQRNGTCPVCSGLGCAQCDYKGRSSDSVQSRVSDYLANLYLADDCSFVWLGSEDENSLVQGGGRPFFVEVIRPRKRFALDDKLVREKGGKIRARTFFRGKEIQIRDLKLLDKRVTDVPQFEIRAKVNLVRRADVEALNQSEIQNLENSFRNCLVHVRLSRKFRTVKKEIRNVKVNLIDGGQRLEIEILCDGGIPIKKLVTGQDGTVQPNFSHFLSSKYDIDQAKPFDISEVNVKEGKGVAQKTKEWNNSEVIENEFEE